MKRDILVMRDVVVKLTQMLAGRGLTVTQQGAQAFVTTDPRTLKPIRVNIPNIPDDASEELLLAIQGFIDHEVAHIFFTDWTVVLEATKRGKKVHQMHNIVEDSYIEREMGKKFPGATSNLKKLHGFFIDNITKPAIARAASEIESFSYLLVTAVRAWAGQPAFMDFMTKEGHWNHPLIKRLTDNVSPAVIAKIPNIKTSREALDVTDALLKAMEPPPKPVTPPAPPPPAPPEDEEESEEDEPTSGTKGDGTKPHKERDEEEKPEPEDEPESEDDDADPAPAPEDDPGEEEGDDTPDEGGAPDEEEPGESKASDAGGDDDDEADELTFGSDEDDEDDSDPADDAAGGDDDPGSDDEGDPEPGAGEPDADDGDEGSEAAGEDEDEETSLGGSSPVEDEGEEGEVSERMPGAGRDEEYDIGDDDDPGEEEDPYKGLDLEDDAFKDAITEKITDEATAQARGAEYSVFTKDFDKIETFEIPKRQHNPDFLPALENETRHMVGVMQKDIERMMASRSQVLKVPGFRSGRLHSASLHRIMANDDRVFRRNQQNLAKRTAVCLLVDCSGSMNGGRGVRVGAESVYKRKIDVAMTAAFALSQTLERVAIPHEVLGFTTLDEDSTSGYDMNLIRMEARRIGRSFSRVEPLHIPIFKGWDERLSPQVKARMAHDANNQDHRNALLRNNVDGESIQVATQRLLARREERHVLIVLSDGSPCAEGMPHELHANVHRAIEDAEKAKVETIGIGIMDRSVERYYPKHIVLNDLEALPRTVVGQLRTILLAA